MATLMLKIRTFFLTAISEGCHFSHMWKTLVWPHHFTKWGVWVIKLV